MSVSQSRLRELHARLKEVIGVNASSTMMDLLAPDDWNTVVRVHHLDAFHGQLRAEWQVAIAELRSEFRTEISSLRTEFHTEIGELRADMHKLAAVQTRWMAGLLGSLVVAMIIALVR